MAVMTDLNVSGPFEIHTNVTLPGGKKVFRDRTLNSGSLAAIDFSDSYAGGSKDSYKNGDQVKNLCYVDDYASVTLTSAMQAVGGNGGITFTGATASDASAITLPSSAAFSASATRVFISAWFKIKSGATNPANTNFNFIYIGSGQGNETSVSAAFRYGGVRTAGSALTTPGTQLTIYGQTVTMPTSVTTALAAVSVGTVFNLAFDIVFDESGSTAGAFYVDFYLNGALIGSSASYTAASRPAATAGYALNVPATTSPITNVTLYRVRIDDLSESSLKGADIALNEYSYNKGYFS